MQINRFYCSTQSNINHKNKIGFSSDDFINSPAIQKIRQNMLAEAERRVQYGIDPNTYKQPVCSLKPGVIGKVVDGLTENNAVTLDSQFVALTRNPGGCGSKEVEIGFHKFIPHPAYNVIHIKRGINYGNGITADEEREFIVVDNGGQIIDYKNSNNPNFFPCVSNEAREQMKLGQDAQPLNLPTKLQAGRANQALMTTLNLMDQEPDFTGMALVSPEGERLGLPVESQVIENGDTAFVKLGSIRGHYQLRYRTMDGVGALGPDIGGVHSLAGSIKINSELTEKQRKQKKIEREVARKSRLQPKRAAKNQSPELTELSREIKGRIATNRISSTQAYNINTDTGEITPQGWNNIETP